MPPLVAIAARFPALFPPKFEVELGGAFAMVELVLMLGTGRRALKNWGHAAVMWLGTIGQFRYFSIPARAGGTVMKSHTAAGTKDKAARHQNERQFRMRTIAYLHLHKYFVRCGN